HDGKRAASADAGGELLFWNTDLAVEYARGKHGREIRNLAASPDGEMIASVGNQPSIYMWELRSGRLRKKLLAFAEGTHDEHVDDFGESGWTAVAFRPHSDDIIAGTPWGGLELISIGNDKSTVYLGRGHTAAIPDIRA